MGFLEPAVLCTSFPTPHTSTSGIPRGPPQIHSDPPPILPEIPIGIWALKTTFQLFAPSLGVLPDAAYRETKPAGIQVAFWSPSDPKKHASERGKWVQH